MSSSPLVSSGFTTKARRHEENLREAFFSSFPSCTWKRNCFPSFSSFPSCTWERNCFRSLALAISCLFAADGAQGVAPRLVTPLRTPAFPNATWERMEARQPDNRYRGAGRPRPADSNDDAFSPAGETPAPTAGRCPGCFGIILIAKHDRRFSASSLRVFVSSWFTCLLRPLCLPVSPRRHAGTARWPGTAIFA
jgi:hypothetical protein